MVEFVKLSYDALCVGEQFMSNDMLIKPENVETFAFAVDDQHPWYFQDSPFGGTIVSPMLLGVQALRLRMSRYVAHGGLNAKAQFEFVKPFRVGMRVRSYGKLIDKYEKRGRHYMVTEFTTKDEESGAVLMRGQVTQMIVPD